MRLLSYVPARAACSDLLPRSQPHVIIPTVMVSFAFSAVLTGIVFMLLGRFKLGALIGFFPRHILVGCIGGVGVFLIETGLEVAAGLEEVLFNHETYEQRTSQHQTSTQVQQS